MSQRLPQGERIAGHILGETLGQGGFGITYKAKELKSGDLVAIKEYFPSDYAYRKANNKVAPKPEGKRLFQMGLEAFLQEANLLRDLPRQEGLMQVRAAFTKHDTAYCVMEYIHGDPLDRMVPRLIAARGHVSQELVMSFLQSMLGALQTVHAVGIIHRDMKPANVMIPKTGQPILIDFGAARPIGRSSGLASMFTRKYAAIEQFPPDRTKLNGSTNEGPWSDIFALSVMLYEMVSQSLPPTAEDRLRALREQGRDSYRPVRENLTRNRLPCNYSPALLDAIDAGCTLMPDSRIQSAENFAERIRSVPGPSPSNSRPRHRSAPTTAGVRKPPSAGIEGTSIQTERSSGVLIMLSLIIILACAAAAYGVFL